MINKIPFWFALAAFVSAGLILPGGALANEHDCETPDSLECTRHLAESGDADNQYQLGEAYWFGYGVVIDKYEAVRWYRLAAEQGNAIAQNNLGIAYSNGQGVSQNYSEAVHWFRLAAEQGYASAQYNLGVAYWNGEGVAQNYSEAVRWYRLAAEQGYASAQFNLGVAYWNGEGVITNKREAYIWYSIAKANGDEDAAKYLREDPWYLYLTTSEIRSAEREAERRFEKITRLTEEREAETSNTDSIGEIAIANPPQDNSVAEEVFENTWRSIVVIRTDDGHGSGIIVRPNIVATNCHVVESGGIVVYKHDDRRASTDTLFEATMRRRDEESDFCLLDVDGLWGIPAAVRKYDTLNIGENVYALGSPEGLDLSFHPGVISQLRDGTDSRYIQTNAAISPGSSGGGLFDAKGNLVGILTSKIADENVEGIGFAIPADLALGL